MTRQAGRPVIGCPGLGGGGASLAGRNLGMSPGYYGIAREIAEDKDEDDARYSRVHYPRFYPQTSRDAGSLWR